MELTVGQVLQLVRDAIIAEPDSFGKNAALRRLARLDISSMNHVVVNVPRPEVPQELPKAKPGPSRKRPRKPKPTTDTPVVKLPPVRRKYKQEV